MVYMELDIVNDNGKSGVALRNWAAKEAHKHVCKVVKFRTKGPAGHPVVTFACPGRTSAENLLERVYGSNHENLDIYLVADPQSGYGART